MMARYTKISLIIFGFVVCAGISAYLTLTLIIKGEETVVVPELVGQDVVSVLQTLTELGLNTKVKGSEFSSDIPINHVMFQEPNSGSEIKRDRDVRIIISKGPKRVRVPNLKDLSVQRAQIILDENGLCLGNQTYTPSQTVRKDSVIAQTPISGGIMARGECVDLLLSEGARPSAYKMPDLSGRPLEDALLLVEAVKLRPGTIQAVHKRNFPMDAVVGQEPQAGYRILEGSIVNLNVNRPSADEDRKILAGFTGVRLLRYRLHEGFLKRHIRIRLNSFGRSQTLMDELVSPGEEIWRLIPNQRDASIMLYEDGELQDSFGVTNSDRNLFNHEDDVFTLSETQFGFSSFYPEDQIN